MLPWLSVWSEVQMICIWSSWCHCHPVISCFSKIQNGLSFWYRPTQVVLEKRPLNGCMCVSSNSCVYIYMYTWHIWTAFKGSYQKTRRWERQEYLEPWRVHCECYSILLAATMPVSQCNRECFPSPVLLSVTIFQPSSACTSHLVKSKTAAQNRQMLLVYAGCLQLLEILEISWNLKFLLEILEISWNFVDAPGKSS